MARHNYFVFRWSRILYLFLFLVFTPAFSQTNEELRWHQWNEGVDATKASGKFMLVEVYTTWCGWCKRMNRKVFGHLQVQQLLAESFILTKLDAESSSFVTNGANQYTEQELAKLLDVYGYPTILVYNNQFLLVSRFSGYKEPEEFIRYLKYIRGKHYLKYSFKDYLRRIRDN